MSSYPYPELLDGRRVAVLAILAAISVTISAACLTAVLDPGHVAPWAHDYLVPYAGAIVALVLLSWSAYAMTYIAQARAHKKSKSSVTAHVYRWEPGKGIVGVIGDEPPIPEIAAQAFSTLLESLPTTVPKAEIDKIYGAMASAMDALLASISHSDPVIIRAYAGDALQLISDALPREAVESSPFVAPGDMPVLRLTRALEDALRRLDGLIAGNPMFVTSLREIRQALTIALARQQTQPARAEPSPAAG